MNRRYPKPRLYTVQFPDKYHGNVKNVVYRSSWERKFFEWCERNSNVIEWGSETQVVLYRCPTDSRVHRYYLDAKIKVRTREGLIKTYLVEIKPLIQTAPPKYTGRKTKTYLNAVATFMKNTAKWEAAHKYCEERNYSFIILTEKELGIK